MGIADDVKNGVDTILRPAFDVRDGQVVPETDQIVMRDGAVKLDATYLYADLAGSSKAAHEFYPEVTAKVIRSYLSVATRLIKWRDGHIRSFDGDRVMGIFIGGSKNTNAVKAAMHIHWAVQDVLKPKLDDHWSQPLSEYWSLRHAVGVDTGEALLVRGGVRGSNDIISIGKAPNVAAKLSDIRNLKSVFITDAVYSNLLDDCKYTDGQNMWETQPQHDVGGTKYTVYGTSWQWQP